MSKTIKIGSVSKFNASSLTSKNTPDSIYYLDTGNITRNKIDSFQYLEKSDSSYPSRAKRLVKDKTIIYSTVRPNQEHFGILSNPYRNLVVSTGFTTIDIIDENVEPLYLYYSLTRKEITDYLHKLGETGVSAYPSINPQDIANISIKIPKDKSTQQKIASVLSALDTKIELNNRINAELEAMAKTLYDYWFVQFDFPDKNGKPYKLSGGKMVYNEALKREIPAGWEDGQLGDWISFKRGISYKSGDILDTGTPFLNLNSFRLNGNFKIDGTKYFNGKFKESSKVKSGDLVIAITDVTRNADITGKAFIIPDIFPESPLMSCDVAQVVTQNNDYNYYLEGLFNSEPYHKYIKHFASGTLVLHLDLNGIQWFKTIMPPVELLSKFATLSKNIVDKKSVNIKENQQLAQLHDWLLPMLMNGQVSIKNSSVGN